MSLPVVLRAEAEAELDEALDYYERQRPGLGVAFAARVREVFDRIGADSQLHTAVFADIRKAVVAQFPCSVFYRAEATPVQALAAFHQRRDPSIWQGRA